MGAKPSTSNSQSIRLSTSGIWSPGAVSVDASYGRIYGGKAFGSTRAKTRVVAVVNRIEWNQAPSIVLAVILVALIAYLLAPLLVAIGGTIATGTAAIIAMLKALRLIIPVT